MMIINKNVSTQGKIIKYSLIDSPKSVISIFTHQMCAVMEMSIYAPQCKRKIISIQSMV